MNLKLNKWNDKKKIFTVEENNISNNGMVSSRKKIVHEFSISYIYKNATELAYSEQLINYVKKIQRRMVKIYLISLWMWKISISPYWLLFNKGSIRKSRYVLYELRPMQIIFLLNQLFLCAFSISIFLSYFISNHKNENFPPIKFVGQKSFLFSTWSVIGFMIKLDCFKSQI